jgi:hypothetical protein
MSTKKALARRIKKLEIQAKRRAFLDMDKDSIHLGSALSFIGRTGRMIDNSAEEFIKFLEAGDIENVTRVTKEAAKLKKKVFKIYQEFDRLRGIMD